MACVATPVSVVTAMAGAGLPSGATVSAFTSLSIDPPMVVVALDSRSRTLDAIRECGAFGLDILGAEQADVALSFAAKGGAEKCRGTAWDIDRGPPRIDRSPAWVASTVADLADGGDHVIVLGRARAAEVTGGRPPLVYRRRSFGTHLPDGVPPTRAPAPTRAG
ncbi:flavin reductase family protein [Streptomyces sp. NRRL B-24484]|uniref:flavin reductase family protein n=1 Tax=Streptomyces sp. NRRL B-24484 TaxID=1463833 RepID=UPI000694D7E0|nr:flavin reductase family protein [Streptomyces sp. NRRL B-24484]